MNRPFTTAMALAFALLLILSSAYGAEKKPPRRGKKAPADSAKKAKAKEKEKGKKAGEKAKAPAKKPAPPKRLPSQREKEMKVLRQQVLSAPLKGGRNSFFHSLLGLPSMTAACGPPNQRGSAFLAFELTRSKIPAEGANEVDTIYFEGKIGASYGISRMVEFHGSLSGAYLSGDVDLFWGGQDMNAGDAGERLRFSRLQLGTKLDLLPLGGSVPDIWASLDFKLSCDDEDLVDSGRPGVAFRFLFSHQVGPIWGHLNVGWALTDGQENFPPVTTSTAMGPVQDSIRVNRIFFWGLSLVWPVTESASLTLQTVGNTNGFRDLSFLDSDVHVLSLGGRYLHDVYLIEAGVGFGLTESSADYIARLQIGLLF